MGKNNTTKKKGVDVKIPTKDEANTIVKFIKTILKK